MRLYGEANAVRGLATGPIETRFARLRTTCAADSLVVWTTPTRWAAGEGLSLRFPDLHLEFACTLADGHLTATKVTQVPDDSRPPDREPGAVGVVVRTDRVLLPPEDSADGSTPDPGVAVLDAHFARLAGRRWGGFAAPLRAALEAEAREDEARTQRLTVPFKDAQLTRGGEEDIWRLKGVPAEALRALDDGEWIELLDEHGRSRTSGRVIDTHPSAGSLVVGVRAAADPPRAGFVRPRSRRKILEQKRALLEELASPTGSLPNLVRLVAAPASMPAPRPVRPARFVNPAVVRNRSQARAVSLALGLEEGQVLLIQGPPGTGKSTTAAEIDVQLILRDPGARILVCSHSNHGTDNMLMKVLPFLDDAADRIARIGFYERIAREARPFYAGADTEIGDKNIIFTTIDALVLQDIAGASVYDYVILDEANRAGVLDSLLALARGKRMILVGDPMQLQPVMSEAEQQIVAQANGHGRRGRRGRNGLVGVAQPGANNVIGKSLFAWIQERRFAPAASVLLDQQNRMHPAIGELVSRVFYANRVRTGPAAPRRGTGLPAFPSPVTWVDTRSLRGNVESRAGGTSLFNVAEARLVTSITRHLASHAPPNLTIGVITAYAEQRDLLRRLMGPHDWPPERQLEIDTVDAFEGREKDIIVLSLVRSNRRRDIGFLRLEQRLNVAVSRSRRLIILVGDTSTLRSGYFHHLIQTAQSVGQIVPAPKLIGQLLHRGRRPSREADGAPAGVEGAVAPVAAPGQETPLPTG
ncbi:MAG TPA: AAA domain-containing protein, partial [Chloroflexota bacterium]|nr:AAA domain-containing protein [Chloroflexota bacterium]